MAPLSYSKKKKLLAGFAVFLYLCSKRRWSKKRRKWVKDWIGERQQLGVFNNLVQELANEDKEAYHQYFRLDEERFNIILNYIKPAIKKQDKNMRKSIQPGERLAITLRFLATGKLPYLFTPCHTSQIEI